MENDTPKPTGADDSILKCDYLGRAAAFELTSLYNIHFEEELFFNSHGSKYLSAHEPQWLVLRKNTQNGITLILSFSAD